MPVMDFKSQVRILSFSRRVITVSFGVIILSLAEFVTEIEELWCNYCLSGTISIQMLEKVRLLRVLTFYPLDTLNLIRKARVWGYNARVLH